MHYVAKHGLSRPPDDASNDWFDVLATIVIAARHGIACCATSVVARITSYSLTPCCNPNLVSNCGSGFHGLTWILFLRSDCSPACGVHPSHGRPRL